MTGTTNPAMPDMPPAVAEAFDAYDQSIRAALLELRQLIVTTAAETEGVGALTEALRWGQPAYLTTESRSGSTIRLAPTHPDASHDFAMFFICHTNLVDRFQALFGDVLTVEDNRALVFSVGDRLPLDELRQCVTMALTYHQP